MFMKICIINNLYPPHVRGGAEQVVVKTVQGLLEAGHEVVVVTTAPHPLLASPYEGEDRGKFTVYRYHPANIFFYTDAHEHGILSRLLWHIMDIFHIGSARYVEEVLREEKPDVVHTHNLMGMSFLIPRVIRRLGFRHIHTVHDVQLVEPSGIIRKRLEHSWRYTGLHIRFYSAVMRTLMGSPEVVISPSQFLLNFYESRKFFSGSKRVVLRNPMTATASVVQKFPHDGIRFLYLGQIEEHKGVVFLVKTFRDFWKAHAHSPLLPDLPAEPACRQTGPGAQAGEGPMRQQAGKEGATLHIAGTGSALPKVEEVAKGIPSIILQGKVDRDALPNLFASVDMTIVPSLCYENSPTVIFESFSFGVPVLASNVEGIAELIREGENGITFTTEDAESLGEKIAWCAAHPDAIREMSRKIVHSPIGLSQHEYIEHLEQWYKKSSNA